MTPTKKIFPTLPIFVFTAAYFHLPIVLADENGLKGDQDNVKRNSESVEVLDVYGRRNQAITEMSEETSKLIQVAGIANDPLSSVFSLPGVVFAGGDDGEPAIRGSSPDDNAFYIDGMPSNYIFHMFGDSIFNTNVVADFTLHPAAFSTQYSNAIGGVFDVRLRDPRNQKISATIDASMFKSGLFVEGGVNDEQAFYFSYRQSLMHLFLDEGEEDDGETITKSPTSNDYQGKYQWLIGDNHKLSFTLNGASDEGGLNISATSEQGRTDPDSIGELKLKTRFDQQGLIWEYFGTSGDKLEFSISHSHDQSQQNYGQGQFVNLTTDRWNTRLAYQFDWQNSHNIRFGLDLAQSKNDYRYDLIPYFCTDHDEDCEANRGDRVQDRDKLTSTDLALYISDTWKISDNLELVAGIRGEKNSYTKQQFIHPRFSLNWYPADGFYVKAKAGSYSRFPNVETALKKLGNPSIKSPKSTHYSIEFGQAFADYWKTSLDVYYKDLGDLPLSVNPPHPQANLHYINKLSGKAIGAEWVIERELHDNWYGWASISWSKSDRTNELTNSTTEYYLDTPLLANLVLNYQLNEFWDLGLRFTARSGAKYTPIVGLRDNPHHPGHFLPVYGNLNSKTLPTYTRLDLQTNYKTSLLGYPAQWTFAVINALGADNVSGYYYAPDGTETIDNFNIQEETGMEMFPYVGLKIQF